MNTGDYVDLQARKVYRVKPDKQAASHGQVRNVDESGEDYLYPVDYFVPVQVPPTAAKLVRALVSSD